VKEKGKVKRELVREKKERRRVKEESKRKVKK
jgi:hypothetical protein